MAVDVLLDAVAGELADDPARDSLGGDRRQQRRREEANREPDPAAPQSCDCRRRPMSRHHHRSVRAGSPHPPRVRRQRIPVKRRPFLVPWCSTSVSNLLLVPLDRRGQWYRSHHLSRDILRAELERVEPGLVPDCGAAPPAGASATTCPRMRWSTPWPRGRRGGRPPDRWTLCSDLQPSGPGCPGNAVRAAPEQSTLTAAELRLLPLLATHMSFPEIAGERFVSPHTVKSQAMSIYRKLGVSSRHQAVTRSRELGLLDG